MIRRETSVSWTKTRDLRPRKLPISARSHYLCAANSVFPFGSSTTSRGTISIVNAATRLKTDRADGFVPTASVLKGSGRVVEVYAEEPLRDIFIPDL